MLVSIIVILFAGLAAKKLFEHMKLPGLVGLVFAGILAGPSALNLLEPEFLALSTQIRLLALIIILLRAGLGLDRQTLRRIGAAAVKMSVIPGLFEGLAVMFLAKGLFGFSWVQGGLLGFILAAVSPAVVVPSMLELKDRGLGVDKDVPTLILAGAAADDVLAITVFSVFLGLATGGTTGSFVIAFAMIPVEIVGGIVLGLAAGLVLVRLFDSVQLQRTEELAVITGAGIVVTLAGQALSLAGLLAVMSMGFLLLEKGKEHAARLEDSLNKLWLLAQLFLFVLIGASVNVRLVWQAGTLGFIAIAGGLFFRSLGVFAATWRSGLSRKERLFCAVAYLPKATVQAAIGGLPLAAGVAGGEIMLAIAVLSIVTTAPLGALAIKKLAPCLLSRCEKGKAYFSETM